MISDKERQIQESFTNIEYRKALAIEHVNTTLAVQIRKMREHRQWKQHELADRLGKHQETVSQWENPDYGRYSITTLKEIAAIFDVALLVKFIPFSELAKDMVNLSETRLSPPSFNEEIHNAYQSCLPSPGAANTQDSDLYDLKHLNDKLKHLDQKPPVLEPSVKV
jgi:transcriptional regulator with XRE-family HTH domain